MAVAYIGARGRHSDWLPRDSCASRTDRSCVLGYSPACPLARVVWAEPYRRDAHESGPEVACCPTARPLACAPVFGRIAVRRVLDATEHVFGWCGQSITGQQRGGGGGRGCAGRWGGGSSHSKRRSDRTGKRRGAQLTADRPPPAAAAEAVRHRVLITCQRRSDRGGNRTADRCRLRFQSIESVESETNRQVWKEEGRGSRPLTAAARPRVQSLSRTAVSRDS